MISVDKVAEFFISKSTPNTERSITHLKLQKLVYYAQAWHLAMTGKALFEDKIEAWVHGPVCPKLYRDYRHYGFNDIEKDVENVEIKDLKAQEILEAVWDSYGDYDGKVLEEFTHQEKPWQSARENTPSWQASNSEITKDSMESYYKSVI